MSSLFCASKRLPDERALEELSTNARLRNLDFRRKEAPRPPASDDASWSEFARHYQLKSEPQNVSHRASMPVVDGTTNGTDAHYGDIHRLGEVLVQDNAKDTAHTAHTAHSAHTEQRNHENAGPLVFPATRAPPVYTIRAASTELPRKLRFCG